MSRLLDWLHAKGFVRPWLDRSHPNFFQIFVCTLIFHLWAALLGIVYSSKFLGSGLKYVNLLPPPIWGLVNLLAAVLMGVGLFRKDFNLAKMGLSIGLFWSLSRFILMVLAWFSGFAVAAGPALYFLAASLHLSQSKEPPINPANLK